MKKAEADAPIMLEVASNSLRLKHEAVALPPDVPVH
jgi:hypothetical protein